MYWFLFFHSYVCAHVLRHGSVHRQRAGECLGFLGAGSAGM